MNGKTSLLGDQLTGRPVEWGDQLKRGTVEWGEVDWGTS